jgi:hypothetical protein
MNYPALKTALIWCCANGVQIPPDVLEGLRSIGYPVKALQDYDNNLTRIVSRYIQDLTFHPGAAIFGVEFADAIEVGLNEAWRLGMRQNNVTEILPEWQDIVDGIVADERGHIPDFAGWITEVAGNAPSIGAAITQAQGRLSLWIGRYNDVYNQAILISADEKTKLKWVMGPTEKHCQSCATLDGVVAYQREWDESQVHPQQPENPVLYCGGWNCQCELIPTDERHTRNAMDILMRVRETGIRR